jgi:hypothetical protein
MQRQTPELKIKQTTLFAHRPLLSDKKTAKGMAAGEFEKSQENMTPLVFGSPLFYNQRLPDQKRGF